MDFRRRRKNRRAGDASLFAFDRTASGPFKYLDTILKPQGQNQIKEQNRRSEPRKAQCPNFYP